MSIRILSILYNVFEMYFQYCNTLLLDGLTIIIIASIDVDNTLEMYFSATLYSSTTTYDCNSISK